MIGLRHRLISAERKEVMKPTCTKCNELARLLLECRDALPAISLASARLRHINLRLADRIENALEPWKIDEGNGHKWTGQRAGGDPADGSSYEWVRYCDVCGMEDTCEDPLPPCPGLGNCLK